MKLREGNVFAGASDRPRRGVEPANEVAEGHVFTGASDCPQAGVGRSPGLMTRREGVGPQV